MTIVRSLVREEKGWYGKRGEYGVWGDEFGKRDMAWHGVAECDMAWQSVTWRGRV
jgi:hypothetical protein